MFKFAVAILAFAYACACGAYAGDEHLQVRSKALAHYIMAVSYDLNGRSIEAINEYEHSATLDNTQVAPHLRLAAYYARTNLFDKTADELKTALKLDPQNSQAHYLLGLVYSAQKKYDLAAKEYEHILGNATKDTPQVLELYAYLAQLYYAQKKYPQAILQYQHILALEPNNVAANYSLGSSYLESNDRIKARDQFKKVLMLESDHSEALNSLAYLYAEDGVNLDDALNMAHKVVDVDPSNGAYLDTLGWVLFKKGLNKEAVMALQKAESYIQDPIVCEHLGDVYKAMKEFSLARNYWKKSLSLDASQPLVKAKIEELEKTTAAK